MVNIVGSNTVEIELDGDYFYMPFIDGRPVFSGFNEPIRSRLKKVWTEHEKLKASRLKPDWSGFVASLLFNSFWMDWQEELKTVSLTKCLESELLLQGAMGHLAEFQSLYNLAKTLIEPSEESIAAWNKLSEEYHVGVVF